MTLEKAQVSNACLSQQDSKQARCCSSQVAGYTTARIRDQKIIYSTREEMILGAWAVVVGGWVRGGTDISFPDAASLFCCSLR